MRTFLLQISILGREQSLVVRAEGRYINAAKEIAFHVGDQPIAWVPSSIVISIAISEP